MEKYKVDFSANNALKLCLKNNITVVSIAKLSANECEITINKSDKKAFLKCFNLKRKFKGYAYIFAAIFFIVFIASLIFVNGYVFKVEINASSEHSKQIVENILHTKVKGVTKKDDLNLSEIEMEILQNPDVSMCDTQIFGLVLYVTVKENTSKPESDFTPIYATADGYVESVNLISGSALVEKGDYVKKGDILIAPQIVVSGEIVNTRALGQVVVLAYKQKKSIFLENNINLRRTGQVYTQKYFTIFNNFVKINNKTNSFLTYEKEVNSQELKIGFVPVTVISETFYETEAVGTFIDFKTVKQTEEEKVLNALKSETNSESVNGDAGIYSENVESHLLSSGVYEIIATVQYVVVMV